MSDSLKNGFKIPAEQQAIRDKCFHPSGTFVEFPKEEIEQSIPERFEKIVRMYPDRLAVKLGNRSLTYRSLNQAANRVACAILAEQGEGEEPIALIVEQGIAAIIAILGVLKAGKFYIPLDPTYPSSRLTAIIEDVQAALILTNKINLPVAIAIAHASSRVVDIDALDSSVRDQNPELVISADTLGYLFYTSGSTGKPKGVTQSHRNILQQVMTYTNGLHISPEDRLTFLHSHGFSASRLDIFGALLNGAGLYPFSSRETGLPNMTRWLQDEEITIFHWVPSLFRMFVNFLADNERFPNLRFIVLGSESVSSRDVDSYKRYFTPGCKLLNRLGTTETGNIRWYFLDEQTQLSGTFIPVGYGIAGSEVFLVDESGNKIDHNQIGKICVKSRYLSPGYWRRPDLTRAVFFPDPTGGNERIYVTEDLGRMRPDGCLEYVGRKDSQVKIRGLRIELQEIEARLSKHPAVRQSVVKIANGENGDDRLIAYLVPIQFQILRVKELRRYLKEEYPDYMIPSVFVFLDSLPLTPSGKVDRRALPEPSKIRPELDAAFVKPRTAVEETLARLWAEVLSIDTVGINDNFFELGGHSLLAVRLVSEVKKRLGKNISVATLLNSPTIAQLARELPKQVIAEPSPLIAIQPHGSKPPFFCAHGTDSYVQLAHYLGYDQPFYGLAQHLEGRKVCHTRIEDIATHYLKEIRTVQPEGPYYIGGHSLGGLIAFEMAQQLKKENQKVALLVLLDSFSPMFRPLGTRGTSHESRTEHNSQGISVQSLKKEVRLLLHALTETLPKEIKTIACEIYHRLGVPLPPKLQTFYVDQVVYGRIYPKARGSYVAQAYSGRAIYLKSETPREDVPEWKKLMTDGLDVLRVPGDHLSMLEEPHVRRVAETLKHCLSKAQNLRISRKFFQTQAEASEHMRLH